MHCKQALQDSVEGWRLTLFHPNMSRMLVSDALLNNLLGLSLFCPFVLWASTLLFPLLRSIEATDLIPCIVTFTLDRIWETKTITALGGLLPMSPNAYARVC
eukprot:scaffold350_cov333-Pavlova_lutheri.AAC.54